MRATSKNPCVECRRCGRIVISRPRVLWLPTVRISPLFRPPARVPKPLPVLLDCHDLVLGIERRALDDQIEAPEIDGLDCGRRSLMAGESALMAMSTRSRMGYLGSCSNVRSVSR
jgi:hypothetical protein